MRHSNKSQDNINRRNFIKYTSLASVGAGVSGCLGGDGDDGDDGGGDDLESGERPVQWIGPAYSNYEEQVTKYTDITGIDLEATRNSLNNVQQKILSGGSETFDVVSVDTATAGALTIDNDATDPVPTENLDKWDGSKVSDLFTNPGDRLSQIGAQTDTMIEQLWEDDDQTELKFPPTVYNFDAIGYNPKHIEPGAVSEWSTLFDDQYQGQVLFDAVPSIGIPQTLMHMLDNDMVDGDIGSINDPSVDQMDSAIDFLIRQKEVAIPFDVDRLRHVCQPDGQRGRDPRRHLAAGRTRRPPEWYALQIRDDE